MHMRIYAQQGLQSTCEQWARLLQGLSCVKVTSPHRYGVSQTVEPSVVLNCDSASCEIVFSNSFSPPDFIGGIPTISAPHR